MAGWRPVHTGEPPFFTPRSLPSHVPGAAHTTDMYRAWKPHAPRGGTAEPCAGQRGHSGLHKPHKLEVGQDLAGPAGHLPSATWGNTVSTPAQVDVSFSLSLELLSYQKLPADQMLPGVDIQQSEDGEKQMVFTGNLLLGFTNQTFQARAGRPPANSTTWGGIRHPVPRGTGWRGKSRVLPGGGGE